MSKDNLKRKLTESTESLLKGISGKILSLEKTLELNLKSGSLSLHPNFTHLDQQLDDMVLNGPVVLPKGTRVMCGPNGEVKPLDPSAAQANVTLHFRNGAAGIQRKRKVRFFRFPVDVSNAVLSSE